MKKANQLAEAEYFFYLQHVKHKYFKGVDRNISFFHSLVKRNNRREIVAIEKCVGGVTTSSEEIVQEFMAAFQRQLGTCLDIAPFQSSWLQFGKTLSSEQ